MGKSGNPAKRSAEAERGQRPKTGGDGAIALYHEMKSNEDFETTADMLFQIVQRAAESFPGKPRHLYLDIDGHRNEAGGFDHDALELQKEFMLSLLMDWLTEAHLPLGTFRNEHQREDLPEHLTVFEGGPSANRAENLVAISRESGRPVLDAETGEWINPDGTKIRRD